MTLASTTSKLLYNGDGSTTVFAVSFVFWRNSDIKVVHRDASGAETTWIEGVHYTLTGGGGDTGTLTVKTTPTDHTPAAGEKLLIKSALPETQGASLPLGGAFPSTTVERMADFVTRLIQQHSEEIARSFQAAETDDDPGTLPTSADRAGKYLAFDAEGTAIASAGPAGEVAVSPFGATLVDDVDAAAALATLGVDAAKAQALGTAATKNTGTAAGEIETAEQAFVDVASAATTNIGAAASRNVRITGTVTITAFDTVNEGIRRKVRFASPLTLTHNATSLILPGLANIATAADDTAEFVSLGSGNWLCLNYKKANGEPVTGIAFKTYYESSAQTITAGGLVTLAHGLGVAPKSVEFLGECTTAQAGYSVGDRVLLNKYSESDINAARATSIYADSINIYVRFSSVSTVFSIANKSTGGHAYLTNGSWDLYVRAWA